jgi:oligopeptide/dipeptide ABC transporter ATP-binding protein
MPLLAIRDLKTRFHTASGLARAVDGVDLDLEARETLAVVGESGCGKTVLALSIMRLVPDPGRIEGGRIIFDNTDLLALSEKEMRSVRGERISMIFQEPMTSLNPVFKVGEQIAEAIRLHRGLGRKEALAAAADMLAQVGLDPRGALGAYPHEMSGGMRQRVVIAIALACDPEIVLADEPTTALDVTIQAQILELMMDLTRRKEASVLLITHDLGIVAQTCARAVVMYAGEIVDVSDVPALFAEPLHPYTKGLMASVPRLGQRGERLVPIAGIVPSLTNVPSGCRFHPRCPFVFDRCPKEHPPLLPRDGRQVRCWLYA